MQRSTLRCVRLFLFLISFRPPLYSFRINVQHRLYFSYLKHLWATGHREDALFRLEKLSDVVELIAICEKSQNNHLRAACWSKLGDWTLEHSSPAGSISLNRTQTMEVLLAYKKATASKADDYRAWHAWALMNFRLAQSYSEGSVARPKASSSQNSTKNHVLAAVHGFVKAVSYGTKRWRSVK